MRILKNCWVKNEICGNVIILKFGGIWVLSKNECGMINFNGGMWDEKNLVGVGFV